MHSQHLFSVSADSEFLSALAVDNKIAAGSGSPTSCWCAADNCIILLFFFFFFCLGFFN